MAAEGDDLEREWEVFARRVDPCARAVLAAADPWGAYDVAAGIPGSLLDDLPLLPHAGAVYCAWAEVADVYEIGRSPIHDAHAALRRAAETWLERPPAPDGAFIDAWAEQTTDASAHLFRRDGTILRPPPE